MMPFLKKTTGLAAVGATSWYTYHRQKGHINPGGRHSYDMDWYLGPEENHGGADKFWHDLLESPNGRFPMTRVNGSAHEVGDVMHLQFFCEPPNPVIVDEITDRSMTLTAGPKHLFKGEAHHSVFEKGGGLFYRIQGQGPAEGGEPVVIQAANTLFAQAGWTLNMPRSYSKAELEAEAAFEKADNYR